MRGPVIAGALVVAGAAIAWACAPAPPPGMFVDVAAEEAVISWDPTTKLQHFVRRASFRTRGGDARDFGFLVPTPTKPELAEADDRMFWALERAIAPREVHETRTRLQPTALCLLPLLIVGAERGAPTTAVETESAPRSVQVLEERRVAGYDAVVLAANDAGLLAAWLAEHGYDQRPALARWLEPYVEKAWIITAFKVTGEATSAVRMSFVTEQPFFPYREPSDAREGPAARDERTLRVFYVGPERVQGHIGASAAWPAEVEFAAPLSEANLSEASSADPGLLFAGLLPEKPAPTRWLCAFMDRSTPRPGTDEVYYSREPSQAQVVPAPIIIHDDRDVPIPLDIIVAVVVVAIVVVRRRKAKATK
jgi:hypothetical protein